MEEAQVLSIDTLEKGAIIADRYDVVRLIGSGGMASVYLAKDLQLEGQKIAMKILHKQFADDKVYVQRFLREVQLMQKVDHPNVVKTFDIGTDESLIYFTMEYVQGESLETIMDSYTFDELQVAQLCREICNGLEAIHEAGIIHRDLKPANILLMEDNTIKVTDFGVARERYSRLTAKTQKVGSICYMAPEIWLGKTPTSSVDFYSLGVLLYEVATGKLPFEHDWPGEVMHKHIEELPQNPSDINPRVPAWLDQLIMRLLSKLPKDRPESAEKVRVFLRLYAPQLTFPGMTKLLEDKTHFSKINTNREEEENNKEIEQEDTSDEKIIISSPKVVEKREFRKGRKTYVFKLTATSLFNSAQTEKFGKKIRKATVTIPLPRRAALIFEIEPPSREYIFFGIFLGSLQVFDGALTRMGIQKFGSQAEGNPMMRYLIEMLGTEQALLIAKISAIGFVIVLTIFAKRIKWIKDLIGVLSFIYLFAAVIPWMLLLFAKYWR